jgi:hypothetical protein
MRCDPEAAKARRARATRVSGTSRARHPRTIDRDEIHPPLGQRDEPLAGGQPNARAVLDAPAAGQGFGRRSRRRMGRSRRRQDDDDGCNGSRADMRHWRRESLACGHDGSARGHC